MSAKEQITSNVERTATEEATTRPEQKVREAVWAIVAGVALPCIPVIGITSVLLYCIFHYRLDITDGLAELRPPHNDTQFNINSLGAYIYREGGKPAYYVEHNPSTITTIASWTSRVVPYLASSIMALVAFFAARHIVVKSKGGDEHGSQWPTLEQLSLLITMLGGSGFIPLKDTLVHRYRKKDRLIAPLPAAFSALIIITLLAFFVPIIGSWFGVATKPVSIAQLTPKTGNLSRFGKGVSLRECPNGPRDNGSLNPILSSPDAW